MRFLATQPHYQTHLQPFIEPGDELFAPPLRLPDDGVAVVIAGVADLALVPESCPVALVEHGAGQTYIDLDHQSYAGGRGRERISLFLCPSERVAAINLARYPAARAVVTGPANLEAVASRLPTRRDGAGAAVTSQSSRRPTVVFTWHWDARLHSEIRTAWPHYEAVFARVVASGAYRVLGHAHPRAWEMMTPAYGRLGVEPVLTAEDVFARADLLVADNTSLLYEAAALGLPTLTLDAPWYRDHPRHGLRFYDHVPGLRLRAYRDQAPDAGPTFAHHGRDHLAEAIEEALQDAAPLAAARAEAVAYTYRPLDGNAATRGHQALHTWAATTR